MEHIHEKLSQLWLKDNEIKIYLASLSYGTLPASILWQKTEITRSNAQYLCQKLVDKWLLLVTDTTKGNLYSPEAPSKIITLLNREYDKIDEKIEKAKAIMPLLEWIMPENISESKVHFFKWVDGIINMLENTLQNNPKIIYWMISQNIINDEISKYLETKYIPQRIKKNIKTKAIINDDISIWPNFNTLRENKVIDKSKLDLKSNIQIYWDTTSIYLIEKWNISWTTIKNEKIADTLKNLFEYVWNN